MNQTPNPLPTGSVMAGRLLGLLVLLTLAAGGGAAIGLANPAAARQHVVTTAAGALPVAAAEDIDTVLEISEAPAQAAQPGSGATASAVRTPGSRAAGRGAAAPVLNLVVPGAGTGPAGSQAAGAPVKCSRFDDAKIHWLLEQVAKTRAENPEMAAGADRLTAALQGALGKNMCASEAQAIISQMCADPAVVRVMNQMVSQLPFFIKPMVGDPCTTDLVSVLNKVGRFVPGLSSEPS